MDNSSYDKWRADSGVKRKPTTGRPGRGSKSGDSREPDSTPPLDVQKQLTRLAETNRQLKRKIFDLYTIFEMSRNFNSVLRYQSLLDSFILTCLAQVGASRAAIYLKAGSQSDTFALAKRKGSGSFPGPERSFAVDSELVTFLGRLNRPVITQDLLGDVADETEASILKSFDPGLVVPLIYQTRLSGILLISDKLSSQDFGLDDIEFLSILANQIAVAIENARLYEAEKSATQHLRAAQQKLVNSERQVALGEMSARVAHEINNPLGIIKNYLLLTKRSAGENIEVANHLDVVGQEIDRIARIVRQLLDFHRPLSDELEVINITAIVEDVLDLMDRQLETGSIEVVKQFEPDCPPCEGSPENIKQVVLNIIINACDAMAEGGQLTIAIDRRDNEARVRFCDTGPGIPPEIIPRIFEPFFTTKHPGQGTGLGLAVCYGIIKRHGGTITYRNTEEGGCFEIRLPAIGHRQDHG